MIQKHEAKCECGFKKELKWGREDEKNIAEAFSCEKCHNLFSKKITEEKKCPQCGNKELKQYIPRKKENLAYYQRMQKEGLIEEKEKKELQKFWETIEDNKCPLCGKQTLKWKTI